MALAYPLKSPRVSSPYGPRGNEFHAGIDFAATQGTPIYAAGGGKVLWAGDFGGGYGNEVCIQHSASLYTQYAHLHSIVARAGQNVSKGQLIGYVGNTGHSFGAHLHFEVRKYLIGKAGRQANTINPASVLSSGTGLAFGTILGLALLGTAAYGLSTPAAKRPAWMRRLGVTKP